MVNKIPPAFPGAPLIRARRNPSRPARQETPSFTTEEKLLLKLKAVLAVNNENPTYAQEQWVSAVIDQYLGDTVAQSPLKHEIVKKVGEQLRALGITTEQLDGLVKKHSK